jgi:hypothetical protein
MQALRDAMAQSQISQPSTSGTPATSANPNINLLKPELSTLTGGKYKGSTYLQVKEKDHNYLGYVAFEVNNPAGPSADGKYSGTGETTDSNLHFGKWIIDNNLIDDTIVHVTPRDGMAPQFHKTKGTFLATYKQIIAEVPVICEMALKYPQENDTWASSFGHFQRYLKHYKQMAKKRSDQYLTIEKMVKEGKLNFNPVRDNERLKFGYQKGKTYIEVLKTDINFCDLILDSEIRYTAVASGNPVHFRNWLNSKLETYLLAGSSNSSTSQTDHGEHEF